MLFVPFVVPFLLHFQSRKRQRRPSPFATKLISGTANRTVQHAISVLKLADKAGSVATAAAKTAGSLSGEQIVLVDTHLVELTKRADAFESLKLCIKDGACFVASTPILVPHGYRDIEDLRPEFAAR
ncbi:MAG: hypothetical protein U0894_00605 [Pirellulales bacterium]